MTHELFKALAAGAVLVILIARFFLGLRGLSPEAREKAIRKGFAREFIAMAAVAALFLYLLFNAR